MPKFSCDNFGILIRVIPPTGIAYPFSDIPPSVPKLSRENFGISYEAGYRYDFAQL